MPPARWDAACSHPGRARSYFDQELIGDFALTSAISQNPIFRFPLKVVRPGVLRVVFTNNEGRQWEVNEAVQPVG